MAASSSCKKNKKQRTAWGKDADVTTIKLLTKMHEDNQAAERRHNELTCQLVSAFTKNNERLVDLIAGPEHSGKGKAQVEDAHKPDSDDNSDDENPYDEGWCSSDSI
jgi:hypothetical protein